MAADFGPGSLLPRRGEGDGSSAASPGGSLGGSSASEESSQKEDASCCHVRSVFSMSAPFPRFYRFPKRRIHLGSFEPHPGRSGRDRCRRRTAMPAGGGGGPLARGGKADRTHHLSEIRLKKNFFLRALGILPVRGSAPWPPHPARPRVVIIQFSQEVHLRLSEAGSFRLSQAVHF